MNIRRHIFGASFFCGLLMLASVCDANLILNGDFSQTTAGGAVVAQELDVVSSTSTYLANWTSTGYNFVFLQAPTRPGEPNRDRVHLIYGRHQIAAAPIVGTARVRPPA